MKIAVVGGGFMGLVLAYETAKTGAKVTVYERAAQLGGLATHHDYGAFIWDKFYHVILPTDSHLINLIHDLGLGSTLRWQRSLTGYYVEKKFYPISTSKEFLLFPPLGIIDKARLAYTIYYGSKIDNWKQLEQVSVKDWLIRIGGERTFEKFWSPLLLAKLGKNYERVSAVFIWTYIKRLFQARSSAAKKEHMGYVEGGYKAVFDRLEECLAVNGSEVLLSSRVQQIAPYPGGGIALKANGRTTQYDKVIFTAPIDVLEKVVSPDLYEVGEKVAPIEYLGVICMVLVTTEPITPYYVLNIADSKIPFTGVIGMSTVVDADQTNGAYLTYFPKYVAADHPLWSKTDDELKTIFMDGVHSLYPNFDEKAITSITLQKAFKVQPLQVLNYSERIPATTTKNPNFHILNTSQFVNDTLNNNSVVNHINSFMADFEKELRLENPSHVS